MRLKPFKPFKRGAMVFGAAPRGVVPLAFRLVNDPPQADAADQHGAEAVAVLFAAQVGLESHPTSYGALRSACTAESVR